MLPRTCSGELYDVLEVDRQCTTAEISQHYRRLALRFHPDRNNGTTVAQFQRIEEAHRVLSDPQQRQLYDTVGREGLKQLGDYGGGMVGSLLLAVGNLAIGCLFVGIFSVGLYVSLLVGCYKIDSPTKWPSWGVILIPVWLFFPLIALASLSVMVASVKRGLYVLLLPSLRLLVAIVATAITAAALDHRLSAVSAFIPWIIWYVLGTVSDVVMMVPTVYRRTHAPSFPEESVNAAMGGATNSPEDPLFPGGTGAAGVNTAHQHNASTRSENVSFVTTPWRTRQYWRDLAELIVEAVCVYTFIALAFQRALQGQRRGKAAEAAASSLMSFWIVFAPLLVFFGLHLLVNVWEGYFASPSDSDTSSGGSADPSATPLNVASSFQDNQQQSHDHDHHHHSRTSSHGSSSSSAHQRPPSCGERVANILIRGFPPACGLYMTAMWAAKAEYEYNGVTAGADPSASLAFLPILLVLLTLAFCVCCGGCLVVCLGGAMLRMDEEAAAAAAAAQQQHQQQQGGVGRSSPNAGRENGGYRSTAARSPRPQASRSSPTAASGANARRAAAAKDVAIEQID